MKIIEIKANEFCGHDNQDFHGVVPEGWAVIPEDMECENFPFGDIEVDDSGDYPVVTSWIPGTIPDPEPGPVVEPTVWDELDAAWDDGFKEGVDSV